jgi:hypothetical protein
MYPVSPRINKDCCIYFISHMIRSKTVLHKLNLLALQEYLLDSTVEEKLQYTETDEQYHHMRGVQILGAWLPRRLKAVL